MDDEVLNVGELPEQERERIASAVRAMVSLGMGVTYGVEEPGEPDASVDCIARIKDCKSVCCTMHFALTKDEVETGLYMHNKEKPYFIARLDDGYCPHMDRETYGCTIWEKRPLRCRRYDCANESEKPY